MIILAEDKEQLQVLPVPEGEALGRRLSNHLVHSGRVAMLGVGAGQRQVGLGRGFEAALTHDLEDARGPGHVAVLAVPDDQRVEDVLVDLEALCLHDVEDLGGTIDVAELTVPRDEALECLPVCLHIVFLSIRIIINNCSDRSEVLLPARRKL